MEPGNDLILKYQEQAILTMSRGELVVKLYDETLKNLKYASLMFSQKNAAAAKKCTKKCRDILNYLIVVLNRKYDLSAQLGKLYSYMIGQTIKADVNCDAAYVDGIIPQLQEIRDAWSQAEKNLRTQTGEKE